jgi:hypothetical protein
MVWATPTTPANKNKIEANIFLLLIIIRL